MTSDLNILERICTDFKEVHLKLSINLSYVLAENLVKCKSST